jgi:hypothetical protein
MHPQSTKRFLHFRYFAGPILTSGLVILLYSPASRAQFGTGDWKSIPTRLRVTYSWSRPFMA